MDFLPSCLFSSLIGVQNLYPNLADTGNWVSMLLGERRKCWDWHPDGHT